MSSRRLLRPQIKRAPWVFVAFVFSLTDILKHIFFLQAYDILKEATSLSDAVSHDVQSVSTLSEVCFFVDSKTQIISSSSPKITQKHLTY